MVAWDFYTVFNVKNKFSKMLQSESKYTYSLYEEKTVYKTHGCTDITGLWTFLTKIGAQSNWMGPLESSTVDNTLNLALLSPTCHHSHYLIFEREANM